MQQSFNDDVKRRESPKKKGDTIWMHTAALPLYIFYLFVLSIFSLTLLPGVGSSWIDKIPIRGVCVCLWGADAASRAIGGWIYEPHERPSLIYIPHSILIL